MSSIPTHRISESIRVLQNPGAESESSSPLTLEGILAPLHEAALNSSSFIANRHPLDFRGTTAEISKFLLLGQRGGG
jgi:hypothetical protein